MPKTYIIGTRGSLLALTQAGQTQKTLENATGDKFELKVIQTKGDINTKVPLWQLEGQNFFTKELDEALKNKDVDLVIHSHKDLGSLRPKELTLAAVTERQYAHDILLVKKETVLKWDSLKSFKAGTSSPRRMTNTNAYLRDFLPSKDNHYDISSEPLRGNVNTRLEKLQNGEFQGIILALAGLERLALGKESREKLKELLKGLTFMVLPQSAFPSAASQGALAIECLRERTDNGELLNKLKKVHHYNTWAEVKRERKAFNGYGGGCHLAVGIHVKKIPGGFIHIHRGHKDGLGNVDDLKFERESSLPEFNQKATIFVGLPLSKADSQKKWENSKSEVVFDEIIQKNPRKSIDTSQGHFYVTSDHCIGTLENVSKAKTLWASGTKTMQKLAKNGLWVHGSADSFGENEILSLKSSKTLQILMNSKTTDSWLVLTNETAMSNVGKTVTAYTRSINDPTDLFEKKIKKADIFYWTSFFQYQTFKEKFPFIENKIHCCGLGKTLENFKKTKTIVTPFAHMEEFRNWINSLS
ncbi:hydroxymethylbilane synthase [Bacteriovoracales bacterium]|nr:hydroxymethylbilane synthase [Bacteriovoracales bacterium]